MPVVLLLVALAACSGEAVSQPQEQPPFQASVRELVTVSGELGTTRVLVRGAGPTTSFAYSIVVPPRHGSAVIDAAGEVSLVAAGDFVGHDALTVRVAGTSPVTAPLDVVVPVVVEQQPAGPGSITGLRVYHSPYADVRWGTDVRLKVQLHDHEGVSQSRLRAYDQAGYDVMSLMDYSGVRALPYALDSVLWPPTHVLAASFLAGLVHVRFFIPNGEQVGYAHVTSPFLRTYIERWQDSLTETPGRQPWHYTSSQETINTITRFGGMPILAHPWYGPEVASRLKGFAGVEMYSAFARYRAEEGVDTFFTRTDRNRVLLTVWDRLLAVDQRVLGVAVNDHFGPGNTSAALDPHTRDSGKVLVLSTAATLEALRTAMEAGAVLAIKDLGVPKDRYPSVDSIVAEDWALTVHTAGNVEWVANGRLIATGPILSFAHLPAGSTYVRAEIGDLNGSRVYTQAFVVRPVGDSDGDGDVDGMDAAVCARVRGGIDLLPDHVAACDR